MKQITIRRAEWADHKNPAIPYTYVIDIGGGPGYFVRVTSNGKDKLKEIFVEAGYIVVEV